MKNILRQYHKIFPKKFGNYWKKNKSILNIDNDLKEITNNFVQSKSYNFVSSYWHHLNIECYKSLDKLDQKKAISEISRNCFHTFTDLHDKWIDKAMKGLSDIKNIKVDSQLFKKQNELTYRQSVFYNYLCFLLYYNLKRGNYFKFLSELQDKTYLGFNDPFVEIDNINITSDKIVSLLDCEKIGKAFNFDKIKMVLEIGAGSGRTSEAIMTINNNLNYVICDIPPAIYISYIRLKIAFPNKKISLLIDINDKDELQKNIKSNDISFVFPHQLRTIDKKYFDFVLAVDCIHEMDKKTIKYYFDLINDLTNSFYFSIWNKTTVPFSKTLFNSGQRLDFNKNDYNIPENWKCIFNENLVFPSNFLSLGYKINNVSIVHPKP